PSQIVPITGMIASNAMTAIGVTYRSLNSKFTDQRQQVLEKLALGANKKQASMSIVRESVKTGMAPSIDRTKTVGLVSLPGMMSGLIFAGIDPVQAIRYQIVVMFMLISVTAISSFIASYMAYREFYNNRSQLII
ncbi:MULTISPECIES: ABC transporter permease, partial [Enterococcus]